MTLLLEVKLDSHIKQVKSFFFAFSWSDITCFFMSLGWLKVELHILHQYKGFFPSWTVWIWVFKLTFVAKDASHLSHLLSLLLSWISLIWVFRCGLWVKFLSQTVHGKGFFSIMNSCNMSGQNKFCCEIFFTNSTFERFFTLMSNHNVPFHMTLVGEICITNTMLSHKSFF